MLAFDFTLQRFLTSTFAPLERRFENTLTFLPQLSIFLPICGFRRLSIVFLEGMNEFVEQCLIFTCGIFASISSSMLFTTHKNSS